MGKSAKPDKKAKPARERISAEERRRRFIEAYLLNPNATQAAIAAGYAPKSAKVTGSRLLTDANVARALAEVREKAAEALGIDQLYVLRQLKTVVEIAIDPEKLDSKGANRALELMGKHLGMFVDRAKVEHTGPGGGPIKTATTIDYSKYTTEELEELERIAEAANSRSADGPGGDPQGAG